MFIRYPFLLCSFTPLPYFFHPSFRLHLVFLDYLFLFVVHSAPSSVFYFHIPTSESRHHFPFSCTLSRQVLRSFLCHRPLILPVVSGFFDSLPSSLIVCVFVPFTQLYIHPSSFCFQSFHFFTSIPVLLVVSLPPSPCSFSFLSSIPSVFCTLPFHPF
jgi:hypothetical protein